MIFFITSNKHKYTEIKKIVKTKIEMKTITYPEIQASNIEDVAKYGINYLQKKIDSHFFIEDSGLFIDDLNGFPGVYSSYVFKTIGNSGILKLLENSENRTAVFKSVIGYFDGNIKLFCGKCEGTMSYSETGNNGFGFDPVFIPLGNKITFAEMTLDEKNLYSHRALSAKKFNKNISNLDD